MDEKPEITKPRRRWRVRAVLIVLLAVVGLVALYQHYTSPERIRLLAESYLQQRVYGDVRVGAATFSWFEGIRLLEVSARMGTGAGGIETAEGVVAPLELRCPEVELVYNRFALLIGRLDIQSIVVQRPHCTVTQDPSGDQAGFDEMLKLPPARWGDESPSLPTVELRNARLTVARRTSKGVQPVEDLLLTVRGLASQDDPLAYDVVWQDNTSAASGHSQIDLREGRLRNVRGGLPRMSIEAVMLIVDARYDGAGGWCDLLGLDGTVRATDYNLPSGRALASQRSATVELEDASISIPINTLEESLAPRERYLRFEQVKGSVHIGGNHLDAAFTGLFHGSPCSVSTTIRGGGGRISSLDDVAVDAQFSVASLTLPRVGPEAPESERRFVRRWDVMRNFYREYDPSGVVDVHAWLDKRAGLDEQVFVHHAHVTVLTADMCSVYFPYEARAITGTLEWTPTGLYINGLTGVHGDGFLTMAGRLVHPVGRTTTQIEFHGTNVSMDQDLYAALPPQYRRAWEQFEPKGHADVHAVVTRSARTPEDHGQWRTRVEAHFEDLSASYAEFPYPLDHIAGRLNIESEAIEVEVTGLHGDALASVSGKVGWDGDEISEAGFNVSAWHAPIDEALLEAIPADLRKNIEAFQLGGRFNTRTALHWNAGTRRLEPVCAVTLIDASIRHADLPIPIHNLSGEMTLTPAQVVIDRLDGAYHDAGISLTGICDLTGSRGTTDLTVQCTSLALDDELREALPPHVRKSWGGWRIEGPVTVQARVRDTPQSRDGRPAVAVTLHLNDNRVAHPAFPVPFEHVQGTVVLDETSLRATGINATYDRAPLTLELFVRGREGARSGTLGLSISGLRLNDTLADTLPHSVRAGWDWLAPSGTIDVELDRVTFRSEKNKGLGLCALDGDIVLRQVGLSESLDVRNLSGVFTIEGLFRDARGGVNLKGEAELDTVQVKGRDLKNVESSWSWVRDAAGRGRAALTGLTAGLYDGLLQADAGLDFEESRTGYDVRITARAVELDPFLEAGGDEWLDGGGRIGTNGWLDAQLALAGVINHPDLRTGTGACELVDGEMYRLPIILAILNAINPATPPNNSEAFNQVRASFYIAGDQVDVEHLLLYGPALTLFGRGTMNTSDWHVDLKLEPDSRRDWPQLPFVTDMLQGATRKLIGLHVTGTLSQPAVQLLTMREANQTIKTLFRKRNSDNIPPASSRKDDKNGSN